MRKWQIGFCVGLLAMTAIAAPRPTAQELAAGATELEPLLPEKAFIVTPLWKDRSAWSRAVKKSNADAAGMIRRGEEYLGKALPPWPEEAFYDFTRNGNRSRYSGLNGARHRQLNALVQAELIEGKKRFIPDIAKALDAFCTEDITWVGSAHDPSLINVQKKGITIDLNSALFGWHLATIMTQFGDALPEKTRENLLTALNARIVNPYLKMLNEHKFTMWWVYSDANWNSVCHAGVVGAALAMPDLSRKDKARIVASARAHSKIYLGGFDADGWTGEGVAYWNYGFGNFIQLAETVRAATGGKEDWLLWPETRLPARSAPSCRIDGDIYPAFADCPADVRADQHWIDWLNARLGWRLKDAKLTYTRNPTDFPNAFLISPDNVPRVVKPDPLEIDVGRSWFPDAEVLINRGKSPRFSAVIKGGHNGVPHNHNDAGSYMVVYNGVTVLGDAGGEAYTRRTFSSKRYESDLLNSYGHPVPYPAQTMQKAGGKHAAKILKSEFTRQKDTLLLDLAPAYGSDVIETLTRSYVWDNTRPQLILEDTFAFKDKPEAFETVLISFGTCEQKGKDKLVFTVQEQTVEVQVTASAPWVLESSDLTSVPTGRNKGPVHRYAIRFTQPAKQGNVRMTFTPGKGNPNASRAERGNRPRRNR